MESNTKQKMVRAIPPKELFASDALPVIPTHEVGPRQLTTPVYHVHTPEEGGVLVYHVGDKYPVKGWPFKEAVYAVDMTKRLIINSVKLLASSPFRYFAALFLLLPSFLKKKIIMQTIVQFNDYTDIVFDRWGRIMQFEDQSGIFGIQGVTIKPQYYCDMVRELRRVAFDIAGGQKQIEKLIDTGSMCLEFDDAYRYFLQDLFGEFDKAAFLNSPSEEIARLLNIAIERGPDTSHKFKYFAKVLPLLFRMKLVKNIAVEFFSKVDIEKLRLDEADMYRCLLWGGWKFAGIPDPERASIRMMIDAEWQASEQAKPKVKINS